MHFMHFLLEKHHKCMLSSLKMTNSMIARILLFFHDFIEFMGIFDIKVMKKLVYNSKK